MSQFDDNPRRSEHLSRIRLEDLAEEGLTTFAIPVATLAPVVPVGKKPPGSPAGCSCRGRRSGSRRPG